MTEPRDGKSEWEGERKRRRTTRTHVRACERESGREKGESEGELGRRRRGRGGREVEGVGAVV